MTAVALAVHIFGAVIWVGGMFAIYVCLRPALSTLEPPQRLRLMRVTFQKFFPWVWVTILLLLASGYWMVLTTFQSPGEHGDRQADFETDVECCPCRKLTRVHVQPIAHSDARSHPATESQGGDAAGSEIYTTAGTRS
jgi:hypothetical protein